MAAPRAAPPRAVQQRRRAAQVRVLPAARRRAAAACRAEGLWFTPRACRAAQRCEDKMFEVDARRDENHSHAEVASLLPAPCLFSSQALPPSQEEKACTGEIEKGGLKIFHE